jgi:fructokinase
LAVVRRGQAELGGDGQRASLVTLLTRGIGRRRAFGVTYHVTAMGPGREPRDRLVGGVEAGGTKFVCAIGTSPGDVRAEMRIPTTTPAETIARAAAFFVEHAACWPVAALGIATFGPVDLDPRSPTFGFLTTTPKPGWANTDLAGAFGRALDVPVAVDTDVNGAALGEHRWGAARGLDPFVYVTVGTGIGGGGLVNGRPMRGLLHPEMGHMRVPHDRALDPYPGWCPYHGDCWEGLASAHAMRERWGAAPETLPADHEAWALEANYLALGLVNIILVLSPERIVVGGGVTEQSRLLPRIRAGVSRLLADYLRSPAMSAPGLDRYIVPPALGGRAGVLGAMALAQSAAVTR